MNKAEQAKNYFLEGYNCCQAVVLPFCEELGISKETALIIASGFGGGMGGMQEICGAVSGMTIVANLKGGYTDPKASEEKQAHYKKIRELASAFEEKRGSIICRTLKSGKDRAFCAELVCDAASILEKEF